MFFFFCFLLFCFFFIFFFFFFQAEDGIRDGRVTGVQTCALPISSACRVPSTPTIRKPYVALVSPIRSNQKWTRIDRKSTRLNSSHPSISYAVFCLKKKNEERGRAQ